MATPSKGGDVFESVMESLADEVIDLGMLGPEAGVIYGRMVLSRYLSDVLDDPREKAVRALEELSKLIASRGGSTTVIKSRATSSSLLEAGLVNILFGCLPPPEAFESFKEDGRVLEMIYNGFKEFVKYLTAVVGRKAMEEICGDPLLGRLFSTVDRADAFSSLGQQVQVWVDELRRLAWDTRGDTKDWSHKALTVNLLGYFRWEVQGRKDESCAVEKPWIPEDPGDLARYQRNLARPLSELSGECGHCSTPGATVRCMSCQPELDDGQMIGTVYCDQVCRHAHSASHAVICQETRDLSRRAALFQDTFVQCLLSVNFGRTFVVSEEDGVVYSTVSKIQELDLGEGSHYVGVSPDLDLTLSKVEAALHGFHCCDIKTSARPLLEYFFRGFCTSIQFLNFVPKNARTPLEIESSKWLRFNMSAVHTVALVTTHSGRKFVLDPTAAQFGWKEYVVREKTYDTCRIDLRYRPDDCEPQERPCTPTQNTPKPNNGPEQEHWLANCVAEDVLDFAEARITKKGRLDTILQFPHPKFQKWRKKWKNKLALEMRDRGKSRI